MNQGGKCCSGGGNEKNSGGSCKGGTDNKGRNKSAATAGNGCEKIIGCGCVRLVEGDKSKFHKPDPKPSK